MFSKNDVGKSCTTDPSQSEIRVPVAPRILMFTIVFLLSLPAVALGQGRGKPIEVKSVILTVIEHVETPAREQGVLTSIVRREGDQVAQGDLLAQIDDTRVQLSLKRAKIELAQAERESTNTLLVQSADKSLAVAKSELERAKNSRAQFSGSISESEIDRLTLLVDQAELKLAQTKHELSIAGLSLELKKNEVQAAAQEVEFRKVTAPFAGVVVDVRRNVGDWVMPGDAVARLVRTDRLRAEGYLSLNALRSDLAGAQASLVISLSGRAKAKFIGKVVFVSPEFDPITGQTRIWAEFDNSDKRLRAGMKGTMTAGPALGKSNAAKRPTTGIAPLRIKPIVAR